MDELLEQFLIESRDLVAEASRDFAVLANSPQATAAVDSAFRAIHTLKGSVALFAMAPAETVLHAAEDILERARKGTAALDQRKVAALVAALDQVDRWIDEIEQAGALSSQAPGIAQRVLDTFASASPDPRADHDGKAPSDAWISALLERDAAALDDADGPFTAFRYVPDTDCFYRGDDPLAVVAAVPGLLSLSLLPRDGSWPDLASFEPFSCSTILEGLSAAPLESVAAAFRLMPDQVHLAPVEPKKPPRGEGALPEGRTSTSIRVDAARIDALGDALGELLVATNAIAPVAHAAERFDRALAQDIRALQADLERVTGKLHRSVSSVRSVPLEPSLRRFPRLSREIAEALGKSIRFEITGQGLEVDKQIADGLFEPLSHLLRNAIDHGIETSEVREAAGKPSVGHIVLAFSRDGDRIVAELSDDGAGIDPNSIKQAAIARGLLATEATEALSESDILRLIFAPGFSTAQTVTGVSGRGVGMDAVQASVEALRGTIEIESVLGSGTRFTMRLPANALITRLLVVEVGDDRYGVALDQVVETVGVDSARLLPVGTGVACVLHGRTVPVLDLATLLGTDTQALASAKLLVTRSKGELVALRVDGFAQRIDTLVRPPSRFLASVRGVGGSTLMSDGGVLLVLDLPELAA